MFRVALGIAAVFAFGLLLGAQLARTQAPHWDPSRTVTPGVRCLDADQDVGTVWQTDALGVTFHLINDSPNESFEVGPIRGGCSCTSVAPESVTIAPGGSATVQATIHIGPDPAGC